MDALQALDAAAEGFARRLRTVTPDQMGAPTPCEGWDVRTLLTHVVGGNRMAVAMVDGASQEEAMEVAGATELGDDPLAAFEASARAQSDALGRPGVLEAIVHHPAGDVPGAVLLGFRIGDLTVHGWDLARAVGADEDLDPEVLEVVWGDLQPMLPIIGQVGVFGTGPSGDVADDAPLQARVLDAMGRRP